MDRTKVPETVEKNNWLRGTDLFEDIMNEQKGAVNLVEIDESVCDTLCNLNSPYCQPSYVTLENADIGQSSTHGTQHSSNLVEEQNKGTVVKRSIYYKIQPKIMLIYVKQYVILYINH